MPDTNQGDELGWPSALRARIVRLLAKEGVLTYGTAPRSLAVAERSGES